MSASNATFTASENNHGTVLGQLNQCVDNLQNSSAMSTSMAFNNGHITEFSSAILLQYSCLEFTKCAGRMVRYSMVFSLFMFNFGHFFR